MKTLIIILIITGGTIFFVFFEVMVRIGGAGVSPSKIIRSLLGIKPINDKLVIQKKTAKNVDMSNNRLIQRWRTAAGILFGLSIMSIFAVYGVGRSEESLPAIVVYPWLVYPFIILISLTIFVFYVMWKKEKKLIEVEDKTDNEIAETESKSKKFGIFPRILFGLIELIFLHMTYFFVNQYYKESQYELLIPIIMISGLAILFIWIAITGKKNLRVNI